jgi:hypothetical protein
LAQQVLGDVKVDAVDVFGTEPPRERRCHVAAACLRRHSPTNAGCSFLRFANYC